MASAVGAMPQLLPPLLRLLNRSTFSLRPRKFPILGSLSTSLHSPTYPALLVVSSRLGLLPFHYSPLGIIITVLNCAQSSPPVSHKLHTKITLMSSNDYEAQRTVHW